MNDMVVEEGAGLATVVDPKRWAALVVLLTGAFLPTFDFFVVNVALPSIHDDLGARRRTRAGGHRLRPGVRRAVGDGGRLGDLYGRKRLFVIGMVGFTLASALCGLAISPRMLIASRVLQGLTAALMSPQVLAIIRVTFPEHERARAIGFFGATMGLASIVAQLVGGGLVQADLFGLSWRPIFLLNAPVGIVALALAGPDPPGVAGHSRDHNRSGRASPWPPCSSACCPTRWSRAIVPGGQPGWWPAWWVRRQHWPRSCSTSGGCSCAAARLW